jgi:hypothetical protein
MTVNQKKINPASMRFLKRAEPADGGTWSRALLLVAHIIALRWHEEAQAKKR